MCRYSDNTIGPLRFYLDPIPGALVFQQLRADVAFLSTLQLMDYSLLIGMQVPRPSVAAGYSTGTLRYQVLRERVGCRVARLGRVAYTCHASCHAMRRAT
jgi:hypothetical protein